MAAGGATKQTEVVSYQLGIDLGTTFAAAAVARGGAARMLGLGARATAIPSAVFMAPGGELFFGEAAEKRGRVDPDGLVVGFKRRVGDSESIRLRGTPISPQLLSARLLGWVYRKACELEGGPPDRLVLTHPANWAGYRLSLLDEIVQLARVGEYERLAEPEAAAVYYASFTRVETGSVIAVYDLGGGTFDVTVLRKEPTRFELIGAPRGVDRLGGRAVAAPLALCGHDADRCQLDGLALRNGVQRS